MGEEENLRPVALAKDGDQGLIINWSDGHRSIYSWRHLRDNCPWRAAGTILKSRRIPFGS